MAKNDILESKKNVKKPGGAPPEIITHKIEVRPYNRTEQDIPNWRRAVQNAESQIPRRSLLYSLYADVDLDGHVEAVTGKRRDPIKAAKWQFVDKEGKPIDAVNDVIDSIGFDEMLEEIINSKFWGYSILEPRFWKDQDGSWEMDAGLIHRLNYRPENGIVAYTSHGEDGINIREGIYAKTVMEVGNVKDLGLYMKAAPYAILKRGGLGDYAAFVQTFGNPLIDATWDGFDESQRIKLNEALKEIGAGGTIIRPAGTSIEVKENNANATGDAHGSFLKFLNSEISKSLLGTTETTESSSSSGYAQSETHQDQDETKHDNDLGFVRKVLNSRFIRILQAYGFDTKGGRFVIQEEERELSKKESFEIHKGLANDLKLPVDDDFLYEFYGIPKPDNYDQRKKEQEAPQPPKGEENPKPEKQKDKEKEEPEVELRDKSWWLKLYERFFVKAPAETTGACGHHHTIKLAEADGFNDDGLINRVWDAKGKLAFDDQLFYHTADLLLKGFKQGWNKEFIKLADAPGFIYGNDDPALLAAFEQNLFRFTGTKTLAEVQRLNELFRQYNSFEEFYREAKKQTEVFNQRWLETEYNTAVLTGEASATYHRLIKQAEIYPYWEYRTAGDHLVRPEHAALDGLILPYNDPRWKKIFPPNGWNCRCYIVPRLKNSVDENQITAMRQRADAYLESTQFRKEAVQGWGVNRADAGEVFTANQQYARKFPGKASKQLNQLKAADWGLQSYSQAKKSGQSIAPEYSGNADDFYNRLDVLDDVAVIKDYNKKPLAVKKANFKRHTTNNSKKRAHRVQLLESLQATVENPNEVWMNDSKLDNYNYLRYYQDKTIIVNAKLINGRMELLTWYELAEKSKIIDKLRRGLLVLKK